jgi:Fe-S-cluster containining protein
MILKMNTEFRQAVLAAAARADVLASVAAVYEHVQREIDQRRPVCVVSGRCCRFEEYGHRLFVTTLEMAAFVRELRLRDAAGSTSQSPVLSSQSSPWDGTGCPFQKNKLCSVHAFRPFGCRMFFCDATSTEWQNERYERFHTELKRLHGDLEVPYFYMEWRQALRECLSLGADIL